VNQDVLVAPGFGNTHPTAVPDRTEKVDLAHAGERRLRAEGNEDLTGELTIAQAALPPGVGVVDLEFPMPVEVDPVGPDELGTRILRSRTVGGIERFASVASDDL
jgi:hypothetical protein